jgi:phospholipid/cholesterol/gamma-HCH transport system permease protein
MFYNIGQIMLLFWQSIRAVPKAWLERRKVYDQLFEIGNASLLMVCILSLFIGGELALETGPILVERGLSGVLGRMIGLSMCKELGPVMMAILIAGRMGSAIAAEIGSMRVYQEIDALRTMNISPVNYLVMPRMIAMVIALPALVIFSIPVGWLGGALVSSFNSSISVGVESFFHDLREGVGAKDVLHGMIKAVVFAVSIGLIACHQGLVTIGGPRGIGRSVTKAVVNSIVMILILDYFVTRFLIIFDK